MRVLLAEDDPVTRHLLSRLLANWGFEVTSVVDGDAAWEALDQNDSPTLAILDWMMPGMNGVDIVRRLRGTRHRPYTYVLLLTARTGKAEFLQALHAGCDDYLAKPFDPEELQARLLVGKRIIELQSQLTNALELTRHQATHDVLTGLLNRRAVLDVVGQELNRAKRNDVPLSVALIDIDHFKVINDTYGHLAGDEVLRGIALQFKEFMRTYDTVGRLGGEEFLVVLPECDSKDATRACERICAGIAAAPFQALNRSIAVTVSIGVATANGTEDLNALIHEADGSLYSAKTRGRNRVVAAKYTHAMPGAAPSVPSPGVTAHLRI